jgi:hypothetical protein
MNNYFAFYSPIWRDILIKTVILDLYHQNFAKLTRYKNKNIYAIKAGVKSDAINDELGHKHGHSVQVDIKEDNEVAITSVKYNLKSYFIKLKY